MADPQDGLLSLLEADAASTSRAEAEYRRDHAERLRQLERARIFAYRRASLMAELLGGIDGAEDGDAAEAAGDSLLRREFGLSRDSEGHRLVLERFAAVSLAVDLAVNGDEEERMAPAAVLEVLADFERWYEHHAGTPFLALYDVYVPQTPVVDF